MEKIPALEDAIEKNSLIGIYSVFYTIAHGDPNFSTNKFREVLQYVKSRKIEGFLQEFDGEAFAPESSWDEDYWALMASSLVDNFCEERINHLEAVGRKVYPARKVEPPKAASSAINNRSAGKQHLPENRKAADKNRTTSRQKEGLISDEKKQRIKINHQKLRQKKDDGGFLNNLFGTRR